LLAVVDVTPLDLLLALLAYALNEILFSGVMRAMSRLSNNAWELVLPDVSANDAAAVPRHCPSAAGLSATARFAIKKSLGLSQVVEPSWLQCDSEWSLHPTVISPEKNRCLMNW
jgi:hypothetical protein